MKRGEFKHRHHNDDELLIPESLVVRIFNRKTGAKCKTLEEIKAYLDAHPETRAMLEAE